MALLFVTWCATHVSLDLSLHVSTNVSLAVSLCVCVMQVLQHASPAHLTSLTVALDQLDNRYKYDVDYLNGYIRWRVGVP